MSDDLEIKGKVTLAGGKEAAAKVAAEMQAELAKVSEVRALSGAAAQVHDDKMRRVGIEERAYAKLGEARAARGPSQATEQANLFQPTDLSVLDARATADDIALGKKRAAADRARSFARMSKRDRDEYDRLTAAGAEVEQSSKEHDRKVLAVQDKLDVAYDTRLRSLRRKKARRDLDRIHQEMREKEEDENRPDHPSKIPGEAGRGFFRGTATSALSGTGINVPFMGMAPAFIIGAAAASAFVLAIKSSIDAVMELGHGVMDLRSKMGGSIETSAKLSAQTRSFGIDAKDTNEGIGALADKVYSYDGVFDRLGVKTTKAGGALREFADINNDVRKVISEMKNPQEQANAALAVYGESWRKMAPYIFAANDALESPTMDKSAKEAEKAAQTTADFEQKKNRLAKNAQNRFAADGEFLVGIASWVADKAVDAGQGFERAKLYGAAHGASLQSQPVFAPNREAIAEAAGNAAVAALDAENARVRALTASYNTLSASQKARTTAYAVASADHTLSVVQKHQTIENSLRAIGEQRADIAFNEAQTRQSMSNTEMDHAIHLKEVRQSIRNAEMDHAFQVSQAWQGVSNEEEDHAERVRLRYAELTRAMGEFHAAEQSAMVRAANREQRFVAFRPDNWQQFANEERIYNRNLAQQKVRIVHENDVFNRNMAQQAVRVADEELIYKRNLEQERVRAAHMVEVDKRQTRENGLLDQQEKNLIIQRGLLDALKPSTQAAADLASALSEVASASHDFHLTVDVNSPDFNMSESSKLAASIADIVNRLIASTAISARDTVRARKIAAGMMLE